MVVGTRLGPYELLAPLGAGGMGEVYRARDTRLGREVAVKVLPPAALGTGERLHRFEQEARAASALNHPNVLAVFDVGDHGGAPYLVTELLDGTTLRDKLAGRGVPVATAVGWAIDVARGLAAAHGRGIVHRDLKPENLFVTRDGPVKILDFGVATITQGTAVEPLATTTWQGTEPGMVIGTVGYMSPEQVRGERVDARSDLFALGIVLYEMLSGERPFTRPSKVETMNAIVAAPAPALTGAAPGVPPALERIVMHCLEKEPARRFQSAQDVAFALEVIAPGTGTVGQGVQPVPSARRRRIWIPVAMATLAIAALAVLVPRMLAPRATEPLDVRFEIPAPANGSLQGILGISSAVSPDGTLIALAVTTGAGHRLFLRPLGSTTATMIEGSEGGLNPFWSPDSKWIGFFTPGKVKRAPVAGGPPQTVSDLPTSWATIGAWGAGDTILVAGAAEREGGPPPGALLAVSAEGGQPRVILAPGGDLGPIGWPSMLPDGRRFLFSTFQRGVGPALLLASLDSPKPTLVLQASSRAVYSAQGYVLFVRDGTLMAQRMDPETGRLSGTPTAVADGLLYFRPLGNADFSVSNTGVLVYQAGDTASRLVWYRRNGVEDGYVGEAADYYFVRLSPRGDLVAADVMDRRAGTTDIELFDLARGGRPTNFTSDGLVDWTPVFSPDERQIAFASNRKGPPHVHIKSLTESGAGAEFLRPTRSVQFVTDWAIGPEGPFLVFNDELPGTGGDVFMAPLSAPGAGRPLVQTVADEADGRVSPDGRWLAYTSSESGQCEVYVRALRGSAERWQVSAGGGLSPRWSHDGAELYYLAASSTQPFGATVVQGTLNAVRVSNAGGFRAGIPTPLFPVRARNGQYEPAPDGRFLVNSGSGSAALPITVQTDWLRRLDEGTGGAGRE